jgi:hypothetical protein
MTRLSELREECSNRGSERGQRSKRPDYTNVSAPDVRKFPRLSDDTRLAHPTLVVVAVLARLGSCAEELGHHSIGEPLLDNDSAVYRERLLHWSNPV